MTRRRLEVLDTREAVQDRVAQELLRVISDALAHRDTANVVITGGTVGIGILASVERNPVAHDVDWSRVHIWWGDERFVPASHPDRNDEQAQAALLSHVSLPARNIHSFPTDQGQGVDGARDEFVATYSDTFPEFDVVLNGIGPDGHVASLFPGRDFGPGLSVIAVTNSPKPPPERLSFTFDVLNNARSIWVVAAGEDKADAISKLMSGAPANQTPATALHGKAETVVWTDAAAATRVRD